MFKLRNSLSKHHLSLIFTALIELDIVSVREDDWRSSLICPVIPVTNTKLQLQIIWISPSRVFKSLWDRIQFYNKGQTIIISPVEHTRLETTLIAIKWYSCFCFSHCIVIETLRTRPSKLKTNFCPGEFSFNSQLKIYRHELTRVSDIGPAV